jgi:hypothetical protein
MSISSITGFALPVLLGHQLAVHVDRSEGALGRGLWSLTEGPTTTWGLDLGRLRLRLVIDRTEERRSTWSFPDPLRDAGWPSWPEPSHRSISRCQLLPHHHRPDPYSGGLTRVRGPGVGLARRTLSIPGRAHPLMTTTDTTDRAILLALVAAAAAVEAVATLLRFLLVHALALVLTLAGWRPSPPRPAPVPLQLAPAPPSAPSIPEAVAAPPAAPMALPPASAAGDLHALPVRELRQLARAAGHRALARSGRRQQLLEALA